MRTDHMRVPSHEYRPHGVRRGQPVRRLDRHGVPRLPQPRLGAGPDPGAGLEAARELGYVPSGNARGLASRTTGVLGLCFPDYSDPDAEDIDAEDDDAAMLYSDQIIRGMERTARRHGYALLIAAS
jgi:hypothetical protein